MNPIYTTAELEVVKVVHRPETSVSDKIAHKLVKVCRHLFDFFSGYRETHVPAEVLSQTPIPVDRLRKEGKLLSDQQWLYRIIFLESIAGVPGMVAGTLRHLRSLRLLVSTRSSLFSTPSAQPSLSLPWSLPDLADMSRGETEDGSTRYLRKRRTSGCTCCTFLSSADLSTFR